MPVRDGISGFDILEERDDAMAKPMTPSVAGMTDGQIEKAVEIFGIRYINAYPKQRLFVKL